MPTTEGSRPIPAPDNSLATLRRGWPLIVAGVVLGVVLALVFTLTRTPTYRASASVLVTPTGVQNSADLANGRTNSVINLDTEAKLLRSTEVSERVQKMLGTTESTFDLTKQVEATVPPNTEVLSIAFVANSPSAAQQGAHAFAQAYLQQRDKTAQTTLDEQVRKVQTQATTLSTTLKAVSSRLVRLPNASPDRAYTAAQRSLLVEQLGTLNQLLGRLTTTVVTPGRLLTDAQLPSSPNSPSMPLNLASGLAVGLLLGLLAAWIRGRRNHRMYKPAQVQQTLGVPVVASVPAVRLDLVEPPHSPAGEAYRRLANTLPAVLEDSSGVILVASATAGTSGDVVATNVAAALARTGAVVTLLQVDRTSHYCAQLVRADQAGAALPPLRVWSTEDGVVAPRYVRESVPGLPTLAVVSSVPAGEDDPPTVDDSGRGIVEHLRFRGNYLVVSAPSTAVSADAQALAGRTDAVVLAVELGTTQEQALDALAQFDDVRAPVLGAVVVPRQRHGAPPPASPVRADVPDLSTVGPANGIAAFLGAKPGPRDGSGNGSGTGSDEATARVGAGPAPEAARSAQPAPAPPPSQGDEQHGS